MKTVFLLSLFFVICNFALADKHNKYSEKVNRRDSEKPNRKDPEKFETYNSDFR